MSNKFESPVNAGTEIATAEPTADAKQCKTKLRDAAVAALAGKDREKIGTGSVESVGVSFFKQGKPESIYFNDVVRQETVVPALIANGITNLTPAYLAKRMDDHAPVHLSTYHTRRVFGEAPNLQPGDIVDIYVVRNPNPKSESGVSFAYQLPKRV